MKKDIHPKYVETNVTCGCGNSFTTRSTRKELKVDICNACHPFYTGTQKHVDAAGRIEKFRSKFSAGGYASAAATHAKCYVTNHGMRFRRLIPKNGLSF